MEYRVLTRAVILLAACAFVTALAGCGSSPSAVPTRAVPVGGAWPTLGGGTFDAGAEAAAGKHVVLVFWLPWCEPCRAEAPSLVRAARRHGDALAFVGIVSGPDDVVDDAEVRAAVDELGLPYPQVRDRDGSLADRYAVRGTPTLIVLGPDGREVFRGHRPPTTWPGTAGGVPSASAAMWSPATWLTGALVHGGTGEDVERKRSFGAMGTDVQVTAIGPDASRLDRAIDAAIVELRRVEDVMTSWRDSPLTRLNAKAGAGSVSVPAELAQIIARATELGRVTDGAFDPTFASVGALWRFKDRTNPAVPDEAAIAAALEHVDYRKVQVDPSALTVTLPAGTRIGLGGIAKGYGVDRAMRVLRDHGVRHGIVNAGGDMKVLGTRGGKPWEIAIKHPRDRDRAIAVLRVSNTCVVTSGDYERFFEKDGRRYHHIIDPRTGKPSTGCMSATVVAPSAELADALATAICVLGPEKGLRLAKRFRRVEAIAIDMRGEVRASEGLKTYLVG